MTTTATPRLQRVLGLSGLLFYGIVVIQPTAPMGSFGIVSQTAQGHVVTTLMFGMLAILLTAISYGRMAAAYPQAGSAYTFVGRSLHPNLGFLVGWCLLLDYFLLPTIAVIWCAKASLNILPSVPYPVWIILYGIVLTAANTRGIRTSNRFNIALTLALVAVIIAFFVAGAAYIINRDGAAGLLSTRPFYDPATFDWGLISTGTSIAVLTYMGFDCISTLSEDVRNPRRNVLLATILLCIITGVLGGSQVYFAQLIWPDFTSYPDPDTAFVSVAGLAGGPVLFHVLNGALLAATLGTAFAAQLGAARLMFAMGRDDVIPSAVFGYLDPRRNTPLYNLILVGGAIIAGGLTLTYQVGAELVNFGAFIAFMGVNIAVIGHYFVGEGAGGSRRWLLNLAMPLIGTVVCAYIWWSLRLEAKLAGFGWLALGVVYCAFKTGLFRRRLALPDLAGVDAA
jgi:amino acid transporter